VEEIARQSKMLDLMRSQGETYKKLYQQAMGSDVEVIFSEKLLFI